MNSSRDTRRTRTHAHVPLLLFLTLVLSLALLSLALADSKELIVAASGDDVGLAALDHGAAMGGGNARADVGMQEKSSDDVCVPATVEPDDVPVDGETTVAVGDAHSDDIQKDHLAHVPEDTVSTSPERSLAPSTISATSATVEPTDQGDTQTPSTPANPSFPTPAPDLPLIQPLPSAQASSFTGKERFNFASHDCAAAILKANPEATGSTAILNENRDSYMLNRCAAAHRFVVVELCEDAFVDTLVLANLEFFSSTFRDVRVQISKRYPPTRGVWDDLALLRARNARELQVFRVVSRTWARYVRLEFLTRHGYESLCPLTLLRVHGRPMTDDFAEDEALRPGTSAESDSLLDSLVKLPSPEAERKMDEDFGVLMPDDLSISISGSLLEPSTSAWGTKRIGSGSGRTSTEEHPLSEAECTPPSPEFPSRLRPDQTFPLAVSVPVHVRASPAPDLRRLFDARFKQHKSRPPPDDQPHGASGDIPADASSAQEGYFRSMLKRISHLERNGTSVLAYLEDQGAVLAAWMAEARDAVWVLAANTSGELYAIKEYQRDSETRFDHRITLIESRLTRIEYLLIVIFAAIVAHLVLPDVKPFWLRTSSKPELPAMTVVGASAVQQDQEQRERLVSRQTTRISSVHHATLEKIPEYYAFSLHSRKRKKRLNAPKQLRVSPVRTARALGHQPESHAVGQLFASMGKPPTFTVAGDESHPLPALGTGLDETTGHDMIEPDGVPQSEAYFPPLQATPHDPPQVVPSVPDDSDGASEPLDPADSAWTDDPPPGGVS
ncbi:hypothetical protein M427DRAFT_134530 [Gonapodya prolifera JEL478]|uniref:SUN domain-containing protein n=1 Tax=Gonapodya prolifera (strain JEL478) TaxID=1344416 RepID=A0A139AI35_GONPJ|nr:hypothetical protein M427DRAFT_134530 [Gonapodya prolifera JEL478]|eukprot:KXS16073.1 hypothetical protein M427DRAFT_134530 [Gonapodya prolifera JEL478]